MPLKVLILLIKSIVYNNYINKIPNNKNIVVIKNCLYCDLVRENIFNVVWIIFYMDYIIFFSYLCCHMYIDVWW